MAPNKHSPMSWWRSRTTGKGRERGFVEAGVAAAGGLLVVGAVVGNGVAAALIDMSDGQTWLADDDGRVVQINPATGQPERRLIIGEPGSELEVSQRDGQLIVTDLTSGMVTAVDLASLVASGARGVDPDTEVLVGGGQVVLVDLEPGTVRAVDPLTLRDLGRPFRTGDLADAVIDDEGSVWIIGADGTLTELDYSPDAAGFVTSMSRPVAGAGPQSRLVPHAAGVTVFAPDQGSVVQVGAGRDLAVSVAALEGTVAEADYAPADLVPASAEEAGRVFLLSDGRILNVDVGGLGCERPGSPAVFAGKVYVPCLGSGRVIVLDASGARASADIVVPGGGDPTLVVDDGRLYVSTPADGRIVVVQPDGSSQMVDVAAAEVPVQAVDRPPPARPTVPVTNPPVTNPPGHDQDPGSEAPDVNQGEIDADLPAGPLTGDPGTDPQSGGVGSSDPQDGGATSADRAPQAVTTELIPDGTVRLAWTAPVDDPASFRVTSSDRVLERDLPSGATSVDVIGLTCDSEVTLTVTARYDDGAQVGASDNVHTAECPGGVDPADLEPTDVAAQLQPDASVRVSWTAPALAPNDYLVTSSDGTVSEAVAGDQAELDLTGLTCGQTLTFTVTASHDDGLAGAGSASAPTADCDQAEPEDLTAAPATNVRAALNGDGTFDITWTAASSGADEYLVSPVGGAATSAGTATSATLSLPPGTYTFVVETVLGTSTATSTASNGLTYATEPGAPGAAGASYSSRTGQSQVVVAVSWGAAAPNGAAVTGYAVDYAGGGASGSVVAAGTSTTLTINCAGQALCTTGATLTMGVTATNAVGEGPSTTTTVAVPAASPPPPVDGDAVVSSISYVDDPLDGSFVTYTVSVTPPATWAAHAGTCTLYVTVSGSTDTRVIACSASGNVYSDLAAGPATVTAYVTATGAGVNATSASVSAQLPRGSMYCVRYPDQCVDDLAWGDPEVDITDVPWTPPEVPEPPVLAAGVCLLGAAGLLRTLRRIQVVAASGERSE
ncbi:hypothetical protein [Occultella kanbiaonis]|uniref:hypothetical protein n=1 Tax=Occultella kanbiaonis TaxID=2675754 RepID=UPI0013D8DD97|nr:hypothetical protein [Occultella kanbiaonis]